MWNNTIVVNNKKEGLELDHDHNYLRITLRNGHTWDSDDIEINEFAARKLLKGVQKFIAHRDKLRSEM